MHPLEKETLKVILDKRLINKGEKIVVGVSGGPDSIALLNVLGKLISKLDITIIAAYLDHGLRPDESVKESELVDRHVKNIGGKFDSFVVDVRSFALQEKKSIEDAARHLRYNYFRQVLKKNNAQKIAVAHTADDQAEEVLLRLIRGTGRRGLAGMNSICDRLIIRPFLNLAKSNILEYLEDREIKFCVDSSNLDRKFLRNKVRLDLLPYLSKNFTPGINKVLRQTAEILNDEDQLLERMAQESYEVVIIKDDLLAIDLVVFRKNDISIQRRIIEKLLLALHVKPGFRQINQIIHLAKFGTNEQQIHLNHGLRGKIKENKFVFSYPAGVTNERGNLDCEKIDNVNVQIPGPGKYLISENWQIEVFCQSAVPSIDEVKSSRSDYLDQTNIHFPLKVRNVLPGDKFFPLGSPGHKKVADFLKDNKISKNKRRDVFVLENRNEIAALLGLRIDHKFMINETTTKVIKVKLTQKTS